MPQTSQLLRSRLYDLQLLPPLPVSAQEILRVFADDSADLETVERVIALDPGLAARIIGLANSAYYGQQGPVLNLRAAIMVSLGMNTVKGLALAMAMAQNFRLHSGTHFSTERFWLHTVTTARAASILAECLIAELESGQMSGSAETAVADNPAPQAYLAGLFHQLGLAALAYLDLAALDDALAQAEAGDADLSVCETRVLGMTHQQAGFVLGRSWQLPKPILTVIAHYHESAYAGPYQRWVQLVHLASRLASWLELPAPPEAELAPLSGIMDDLMLQAVDLSDALNRLRREQEPLLLMVQAITGGPA